MSIEQNNDPVLELQKNTQDQISALSREMTVVANFNARFRKCDADYVAMEATVGDRMRPELLDDLAEDEYLDMELPECDLTYKFEAERQRLVYVEEDRIQQVGSVIFTLSTIGLMKNMYIPGHLAEKIIGLPAEEATEQIGAVTKKSIHMYTLMSGPRTLNVCETSMYLDLDGDPLHEHACSCENNVIAYVDTDENERSDGNVLELPITIKQLPSSDLYEKSQHESIAHTDANAAIRDWQSAIEIGEQLEWEIRYRRAVNARAVFRITLQAIWTQAGLDVSQQSEIMNRIRKD